MLHISSSWFHIIKPALLCGTFVTVFTDTFHLYLAEFFFYIYSGADESVIFLDVLTCSFLMLHIHKIIVLLLHSKRFLSSCLRAQHFDEKSIVPLTQLLYI